MRGFPLLNVILVVAFFALAWWPLQKAIGEKSPTIEPLDGDAKISEGGTFSLEVTSSHPLERFSVSHLRVPLLVIDAPGDAMDELETGHEFEGIQVPPEGAELWIEASFASSGIDDQRPVLRLELVPDDVERELGAVTLWGELGGATVDAPAVFLWKSSPE